MKANEAPERLYLSKNIYSTFLYQVPDPDDETAVEYTRTDAFIEKACEFIGDRVNIPFNVESHNGEPLADSYIKYASARLEAANKMIDEFRKYMRGE